VDAAEYIRHVCPEAFIFVGNTVGYSIPKIILDNSCIDAVVLGEGEATVVELVDAYNNGRSLEGIKGVIFKTKTGTTIHNGNREVISDISALPFPAWHLLPMESYFKNAGFRYCVISTVRGCPYNCSYCCKTYMGYRVRYRTPESIIDELLRFDSIYKIGSFYFFDDLSTINKDRLIRFCMLKMNSSLRDYEWTLSARVNLVDDQLIKTIKNAGCSKIGFGIESVSQSILDSINKKMHVKEIEKAVNICDRYKLNYNGSSFMIGYVDQTVGEVAKNVSFCKKHNIAYTPHFITPMPSTPLYDYALENGLIKDELGYLREFSNQGNTNFLLINLTKNFSDDDLQALHDNNLYYPVQKAESFRKRMFYQLWRFFSLPYRVCRYFSKEGFRGLSVRIVRRFGKKTRPTDKTDMIEASKHEQPVDSFDYMHTRYWNTWT
jgi:radical SAM superfamily enzyme YgiQ (UPF0313 family)